MKVTISKDQSYVDLDSMTLSQIYDFLKKYQYNIKSIDNNALTKRIIEEDDLYLRLQFYKNIIWGYKGNILESMSSIAESFPARGVQWENVARFIQECYSEQQLEEFFKTLIDNVVPDSSLNHIKYVYYLLYECGICNKFSNDDITLLTEQAITKSDGMLLSLIDPTYICYHNHFITSERKGLILDVIISELYYGDKFSLLSSKDFSILYWAIELYSNNISKESHQLFFSKNTERAISEYLNRNALDARTIIQFSTVTAKQLYKKVKSKKDLTFYKKRKICKEIKKDAKELKLWH